MPRQNSPSQLGTTPLRPSMRPAQINIGVASKIGQAGRAMGAAIADAGAAFGSIASRAGQAADKQNDARFNIEWMKAQNDLYNETAQSADERGTQWQSHPERLQKKYEELNQKYPVSGADRNTNRELRATRSIINQSQKALRNKQSAERKYFGGIETKEIAGVAQRIAQDPSEENFRELSNQALELIEGGRGTYYTNGQADARKREVLGMLTMQRYQSLLRSDPEAAKSLLDNVSKGKFKIDVNKTTPFGGKIWTDRVPSAQERQEIFKNGGVVINLDTNWSSKRGSQTSPMVVIPNRATPEQRKAAEAFASRVAEVYKRQFGKSLKPRVVTRGENGRGRSATIHTEPFALTDKKAVQYFSSKEGMGELAAITRETLGKIPGAQFSLPHNSSKGDRGAHASGTNEVKFAKQWVGMIQGGGGAPAPSQPELAASKPQEAERPLPETVVSQEIIGKLKGVAQDDPNGKLFDYLSDEQGKALMQALPDSAKNEDLTVADAVRVLDTLGAENAVANIEREMAGQEAQPDPAGAGPQGVQLGQSQELPMGLLEQGQSFTVNSRKHGEMSFSAEALNAIPRKMLNRFRRQAREQAAIRRKENQAVADDLMAKQLETVQRTGKAHGEWNPEVITEAYRGNPKKIAQFNKRLEVAKEMFEVTGDAANLPSESLEARLANLENRIVDEDGADPETAKAFKRASAHVKKVMSLRRSDPAKAVMDSREVRDAMSQIPNGKIKTKAHLFGVVDARLKAQTRLGMIPTPITKREADNLIAPIMSAPRAEKRDVAMKIAQDIYKSYGRHAALVLRTAQRLSSLDTADDRDMLTAGQFQAERDAAKGKQDTTNQVENVINGKFQGRLEPNTRRNPYDQFD